MNLWTFVNICEHLWTFMNIVDLEPGVHDFGQGCADMCRHVLSHCGHCGQVSIEWLRIYLGPSLHGFCPGCADMCRHIFK